MTSATSEATRGSVGAVSESAATRPRAGRRGKDPQQSTRAIKGNRLAFWLFFSPFLIGLIAFTIVPLMWGAGLSFFEAKGTVLPTRFVGFQNFKDFLVDDAFLQSLRVFTVFAIFIVPVTMIVSLGLALLVNSLPRFQGFFRSVFFLPTAVSYVIASLVWKLALFNGLESGVVNHLLGQLGLDPIATWLQASPYWWIVLVSVRLWLQVGFYLLLFLAGLQRIPQQLYEAAAVDGVKQGWKMFRWITLPQLRATAAGVLLLLLIAAFQAFDEFYNLTGNNPATRPPLLYLYNISLGSDQDFGHGSAGSLVLTGIMVVVALIQTAVVGFGNNETTEKKFSIFRARRQSR